MRLTKLDNIDIIEWNEFKQSRAMMAIVNEAGISQLGQMLVSANGRLLTKLDKCRCRQING